MGHLNSHLLWHKYAAAYYQPDMRVLEIGPAGNPSYYEKALKEKYAVTDYTVLDIGKAYISGAEQHPRFILAADPLHYPIAANTFDIVFSDQVLAHVDYFWQWYGELVRITRPGGYIITINSYSYPSCPSPVDAWRVHSDGMKLLNQYWGLETLLSTTESVEMDKFSIPNRPGYYFAGASIEQPFGDDGGKTLKINLAKKYWNKVVGRIPKLRAFLLNPVQVSFDTITIARKAP